MRLINVNTFELHEFYDSQIPPYAILSHTWGDQEVTFEDWKDLESASYKEGYNKIYGASRRCLDDNYEWLWVDTNCIDKSSSAELSEAINSMYRYYEKAKVCYVYLSDVSSGNDADVIHAIRKSRWFTRGWTLQELLVPRILEFYAIDWSRIELNYTDIFKIISEVTGIERRWVPQAFTNEINRRTTLGRASIAQKMSWLAKRCTTRAEDMAYCMLGIFGINMPLLYGEGTRAFTRLQEEIIKTSNDHTIFCWTRTPDTPRDWSSPLAPSARQFKDSRDYVATDNTEEECEVSTFSMTNAGLLIQLPLLHTPTDDYYVVLEAALGIVRNIDRRTCLRVEGVRRGSKFWICRAEQPAAPMEMVHYDTQYLNSTPLLFGKPVSTMSQLVPKVTYEPGRAALFVLFDPKSLPSKQIIFKETFGNGDLDYPGSCALMFNLREVLWGKFIGFRVLHVRVAPVDAERRPRETIWHHICIGVNLIRGRRSLRCTRIYPQRPNKHGGCQDGAYECEVPERFLSLVEAGSESHYDQSKTLGIRASLGGFLPRTEPMTNLRFDPTCLSLFLMLSDIEEPSANLSTDGRAGSDDSDEIPPPELRRGGI